MLFRAASTVLDWSRLSINLFNRVNYSSFAGKALKNSGLNGPDDGLNGFGIIMGPQAYQDVHFAYVDELAKKIIGQKYLFRQSSLRAKLPNLVCAK